MKEGIEQGIGNAIFQNKNTDKSSLDKVYAAKEIESFRLLSRKTELTREDVLEMMYLLCGVESKLVNYGGYDRYILVKFFVWIREFVNILETLYDYKDQLEGIKRTMDKDGKEITTQTENKVPITENSKIYISNNIRLIQHSLKFLIDLYLVISRSTLSLGATAFKQSLENRFDVSYNEHSNQNATVTQQPQQRFKLW